MYNSASDLERKWFFKNLENSRNNGTRMMNANYENSSNQYQASVSIEI